MSIYVTRDGQNYGPYTPEQAHAMIAQNQLYPGDLACPEGQQQWVPLGQILGIPPTQATAPAHPPAAPAAPLGHNRLAVPVAQPATAIGGTAYAPTAPGPTPGGPAAHYAIQQSYLQACRAYNTLGFAAALGIVGIGLPALAWAAGGNSANALMAFFGKTLGLKWASIIGLSIAALCGLWFVSQKKKASDAKVRFQGMRSAGL